MNGEIEDLKNMCALKNAEINELINKYEKIEGAMIEYKFNAEKAKDY